MRGNLLYRVSRKQPSWRIAVSSPVYIVNAVTFTGPGEPPRLPTGAIRQLFITETRDPVEYDLAVKRKDYLHVEYGTLHIYAWR
jgi:hypothetical protein